MKTKKMSYELLFMVKGLLLMLLHSKTFLSFRFMLFLIATRSRLLRDLPPRLKHGSMQKQGSLRCFCCIFLMNSKGVVRICQLLTHEQRF
jgi:hypothetical protein